MPKKERKKIELQQQQQQPSPLDRYICIILYNESNLNENVWVHWLLLGWGDVLDKVNTLHVANIYECVIAHSSSYAVWWLRFHGGAHYPSVWLSTEEKYFFVRAQFEMANGHRICNNTTQLNTHV